MYSESEGIVLRQVKVIEGRRLLKVFTQKYGKISMGTNMSEGRGKNKSALAIRPFTYGRYEIFKNRDYYNLNGAEVIKSFYGFGDDIDKYYAASYCLELTDKVLPEEMPQPRLFHQLKELLEALEKRKTAFGTLTIAYMIKLLKEMGMMPELGSCTVCGEEKGKYLFSVPEGGIICQNCAEKKHGNEASDKLIFQVNFDIVNVIGYFADKPISAFEKVALKEETAGELINILKEYFSYHLDVRNLKSESVLMI